MEIRKYNGSTSFGLTARYSQKADLSRKAAAQINPVLTNAIDAGKVKFANITQRKSIKGDFCITDVIAQSTNNFIVKFFVKEVKKPIFSDQITIDLKNDSMTQFVPKKITEIKHTLMEKITTKFMESYKKNAN